MSGAEFNLFVALKQVKKLRQELLTTEKFIKDALLDNITQNVGPLLDTLNSSFIPSFIAEIDKILTTSGFQKSIENKSQLEISPVDIKEEKLVNDGDEDIFQDFAVFPDAYQDSGQENIEENSDLNINQIISDMSFNVERLENNEDSDSETSSESEEEILPKRKKRRMPQTNKQIQIPRPQRSTEAEQFDPNVPFTFYGGNKQERDKELSTFIKRCLSLPGIKDGFGKFRKSPASFECPYCPRGSIKIKDTWIFMRHLIRSHEDSELIPLPFVNNEGGNYRCADCCKPHNNELALLWHRKDGYCPSVQQPRNEKATISTRSDESIAEAFKDDLDPLSFKTTKIPKIEESPRSSSSEQISNEEMSISLNVEDAINELGLGLN